VRLPWFQAAAAALSGGLRLEGHVGEDMGAVRSHGPLVAVEGVQPSLEVHHVEIEVTVVVQVPEGRPHAEGRVAHLRDAGDVCEPAPSVVSEEPVRPVVCEVEVLVAVVVVIAPRDGLRGESRQGHPCDFGDVGEPDHPFRLGVRRDHETHGHGKGHGGYAEDRDDVHGIVSFC